MCALYLAKGCMEFKKKGCMEFVNITQHQQELVNITQISRSTKAHTSSIRTKHIIIPPRAAARGGAALRTPLPTFHQQPVLIARVPRYPAQIFSIFRLPLRLHLLHELQLPSVIRHNNKTNKQQQSQKESFIKCGQDRPSQYTQGGLGGSQEVLP